jgi:ribosomal protein L3 glutamine methyltransferase
LVNQTNGINTKYNHNKAVIINKIKNKINNNSLFNAIVWAEKLFSTHKLHFGHGTTNARDEAVAIASYVLNLNLYEQPLTNVSLTARQINHFIKIAFLRVQTGKPLPYITNTAWFAQRRYYVDSRVIIPRSPFAELINNSFKPWIKFVPDSILDLCTGSGCIAIACCYAFSSQNSLIKIDGVDLSTRALAVAAKNLKLHNLSQKINLIQSDLFNRVPSYTYDLIVSNPPYVDEKTFRRLPKEFHFEPKMAFTAGTEGLAIVSSILRNAINFLSERGVLIVEVGYAWKKLIKLYPQIHFNWIQLKNGGEGIFMLTQKQLKKYQNYKIL